MPVVRLLTFSVLLLFAFTDVAVAERVVISRRTKLRKTPGEMGKVVMRLRKGQVARIVTTKGRWYKVRVGKRSGWVTRTTVRRAKKPSRAKRSRRWGRKSSKSYGSWRGKAMVRERAADLPAKLIVRLDRARVFKKPRAGTKVVFAVGRGAELSVLGRSRRGRWYLVQADDSTVGWISAAAVQTTALPATAATNRRVPTSSGRSRMARTTARTTTNTQLVATTGEADEISAPALPLVVPKGMRMGASFGIHSLSSEFHSNGSGGLGNYDLNTSSPSLVVQASYHKSISKMSLGVFAAYRGAYATPGVHYEPSAGGQGDVNLYAHAVDARLALGARVSDAAGGVRLYAVAGYHYDVKLTDDLNNIGMLPNESSKGVLVGVRLEVPRLAGNMAARISIHTLAGGSLGQTAGLMDGASSEFSATYLRLGLTRKITGRWSVLVDYYHDRATVTFNGASSRQADVTTATRSDRGHSLAIGVGRRL